jgi:hypothetical protein
MSDQAISLKVEKARRYAEEPERMRVSAIEADFHGDNSDHHVSLGAAGWHCYNCDFFDYHGTCAHVLTMQRLLSQMLPDNRRYPFFDVPAN